MKNIWNTFWAHPALMATARATDSIIIVRLVVCSLALQNFVRRVFFLLFCWIFISSFAYRFRIFYRSCLFFHPQFSFSMHVVIVVVVSVCLYIYCFAIVSLKLIFVIAIAFLYFLIVKKFCHFIFNNNRIKIKLEWNIFRSCSHATSDFFFLVPCSVLVVPWFFDWSQ